MEVDSLVGFRFKPTNEEIICLLELKRLDPNFSVRTVKEIDFYRFDPWELPWYSGIQSKESIWYFYCKPYNFKNSKNSKHRKTKSGSWKITGKGSTMKAKNTEVVIGSKKILSFYRRGHISKETNTEWVMHEIHVKDDPRYKEDFVVCRLERRRDNKPSISTSDDSESSHLVVAEDTYLKFVLQPNPQVVYDRNHGAEKTSLLLSGNLQFEDQPPSQHLTSDYSNHATEETVPTVECQQLPSHYFNSTSDYINHFTANIFQMDEFQHLPSHHLTSDFISPVAEHSFPVGESMLFAQLYALQGSDGLNYQSLPALQSPIDVEEDGFSGCNGLDHNSFSAQLYALQGSDCLNYHSLPALQSPIDIEEDGFSGCNGLDHNSFSAQQYPINPEQLTSSYFDGFSDCNVQDFQLDNQQEDLISQWAFQDKFPPEETEHIPSPCFNSSKPVTEVHFGESSFTNTETFNACVNGYFPIDSGDYYVDSIWNYN